MTGEQKKEIPRVVEGLARAWNDGDSLEFASYFAEDGDLVNIHGMRLVPGTACRLHKLWSWMDEGTASAEGAESVERNRTYR